MTVGVEISFPVHATVVGVVQSCGHKLVGSGAEDWYIDALGAYSLVRGSGTLVLDVFWKFLGWIREICLEPSGIPVAQVAHGLDIDKTFKFSRRSLEVLPGCFQCSRGRQWPEELSSAVGLVLVQTTYPSLLSVLPLLSQGSIDENLDENFH